MNVYLGINKVLAESVKLNQDLFVDYSFVSN